MKPFFSYLFLLILIACRHPGANIEEKRPAAIDTTTKLNDDVPLTKEDSAIVIISTENNDTLSYTNFNLRKILKYYPELNYSYALEPDLAYDRKTSWKNINEEDRTKGLTFNGESGQDNYYLLYSYFLKKKNGVAKYRTIRIRLINIYRYINGIHGYLNDGGTYFGHQNKRILGYAEYGVYYYRRYGDRYMKNYNIEYQKKLFIASLRQFVSDEVDANNGNGLRLSDKKEKITTIYAIINNLETLITDYFLLKQAQLFEYNNY
ncbi:MAG TPA: hypothetical protein VG738_25335 [Chitinophagaceae bacterium]|nr:hypothetical protein [Chitinophagaceae bacterium]